MLLRVCVCLCFLHINPSGLKNYIRFFFKLHDRLNVKTTGTHTRFFFTIPEMVNALVKYTFILPSDMMWNI